MIGVLEREHKASRLKVLYISFTFTSFHNCSLENNHLHLGNGEKFEQVILGVTVTILKIGFLKVQNW